MEFGHRRTLGIKRFIFLVLSVFAGSNCFAESSGLSDAFYSNGRYYVVVAVITIIMLGLFIYLFRLDKKIKELEKEYFNTNK